MTIVVFLAMLPDDNAACEYFTSERWPDGVRCPYCDGGEVTPYSHKTISHWCKDCRKSFVRAGGEARTPPSHPRWTTVAPSPPLAGSAGA